VLWEHPTLPRPNGLILKRLVFGFILLLAMATGLLVFRMPDIKPATTSLREFSAARAVKHVEAIAQYPHPIGSSEIEQVRDYIVSELVGMGISPEVQETTVPDYFGTNNNEPVDIRNIFAVLPGANPTGSVLMAAHYDTVPLSPGANDDSSGVATLLETARSLTATSPLRNDVIVLFTDAEEPGQFRYGARFFVANYESTDDVRLVLNFEALGHTGPSIMFETAPGNSWLIEGLTQGAPDPVAFSFMSDLYRLVAKGGTDFAAFEEAGINGLNFAYSFERTVYHTSLDNIESLDQRSLQHHGDYAFSLVRHFGDLDLSQISSSTEGDSIYHSIPGSITVRYPASWGIPLVLITGALLVWLIVVALRKGFITTRDILLVSTVLTAELIAVTIVLTLAWWGIDEIHLAFGKVIEPTYKAHVLFVAFLVLAVAMMIALRAMLHKRLDSLSMALGAVLFWWMLALAAGFCLPGFNIILVWPLLFSLLPLGWVILRKSSDRRSWGYLSLISVSAVVSVVLMTVPVYLSFQAMGTASPGFSGSPSFPIIGLSVFFWVMLLGLLLPHLEFLVDWRQRKVILGLLATAVLCLIAGCIIPGVDITSFGLSG